MELCVPVWLLELPPLEAGPANDYRLLCNELMKLMLAQQLFVFVTAAATDRKTGRTVIVSVLESLRLYLPSFTLSQMIDEIEQWQPLGESLFERLRRQLNLPPGPSLLAALIPL